MKSKCSFILKSATALVLALLLLFGTVATSLAAVADELAEAGAQADVAESGLSFSGGKRLYLEQTSSISGDSYGIPCLRVYNSSTSSVVKTGGTVTLDGKTCYYADAPSGTWTGYQWVRSNKDNKDDIWAYGTSTTGNYNACYLVWNTGYTYTVNTCSFYNWWLKDSVIYFDGTKNTSWDGYSMFVKGANSGSDGGIATTKIATHLYKYKFTSPWNNVNAYWWRGNNTSTLWNYANGINPGDYYFDGKNAVSPTGSSVTNGNGTVAALSLTSISAPTLSATTTTPTYGDANTITASGNTLNYTFNGGARTTTLLSTDAVYNFYVDGSSSAAQSSTTKTYDASGLSVGSHTITCKISSSLTGLTSSAGSVSITVAAPTHTVSRSGAAPSNGTIQFSTDNSTWEDGPITVAEGANYYVKATPNSNYKISSFTVGGAAVPNAAGSTSAKTYTGTMSTSDVTASASFALQSFNVNKSESGDTTGGTVKVGDTAITAGGVNIDYGTNYTVTVDAPDGYKVTAVSGISGTTTGLNTANVSITGVTISATTTISVTYASAGTCGFTLSPTSGSVNIGATTTFTVSPNAYHSSGTISVGSSNSSVATASISDTTVTVTGVAPGTATITVSCSDTGSTSATYSITVNEPTISVGNKTGLRIGETYTPEPTLTNPSTTGSGWSVVYSRTSGTYSTTNGSSITGDTYNSSATTFKASFQYNGVEKASTTFTVKTSDPTITMTNTAVSLDIGGTNTRTATCGNIGDGATGTITYSSSATSVASVNSTSGQVTAKAPGTATITATYTVKIGGTTKSTKTATYTVNVSTPGLTMSNITGKKIGDTSTFTPASYSNPSSLNGTVSYAIKSGDSITISGSGYTAVKPGTTTVTATYNYSKGGQSYTCAGVDFTVAVGTPTVSFGDTSAVAINIGATATRTASGSTIGTVTSDSITYGSDDTDVATISSSGVITGKAAGETTVYATRTIVCNSVTTTVTTSTKVAVTVNTPTINVANNTTIKVGETWTPTPTLTNPSTASDKWSVGYVLKSGTTATTNGTTITAVNYGSKTTFTAQYKYDGTVVATKDFDVTPVSPSISAYSYSTINVGGTANPSVTKSNVDNMTVSYSIKSGSAVTIDSSSGQITGVVPTASNATTVTVTYTYGTCSVSRDATVTVNTPTINQSNLTIAKGDSKALSATTSNPSGLTIAYELSGTPNGVSLSGSNVIIASNSTETTATVIVKAKNSAGTVVNTKNVTITIVDPSLTITDVANDSTQYLTVGTPFSKALTNNYTGTAYSVTSSNTAVATAVESSGTLTITPVAKGTATITVTCTKADAAVGVAVPARFFKALELASTGANVTNELVGSGITATQTFTVNVAEADTYKYVYFTNGVGWSTPKIYLFGGSDTNAAFPGESMVKIGKNENNQDVYAIRYDSSKDYTKCIICNSSDNSNRVQLSGSTDLTLSSTQNAFWCNKANSDSDAGRWNCTISIPQVTIDDATAPLGSDYTLTATKVTEANVGEYNWVSGTTSVATVTADTNTTASTTVHPVDAGTTVVTVKAFAVTPTNWKSLEYTSDDAFPYIGSTDTATITVTADDRTVTYGPKASYDHIAENYTNNEGGTVTTSPSVVSGGTVAHGTTVTFTAAPAAGYKLVGWSVNGAQTFPATPSTTKEVRVTADTTVYALFDKYYHVTINSPSGGTVKNAADNSDFTGSDVVWNVSPLSIKVTPNTGYEIDYANSTNLTKYYTVDTSAVTGTVTINGRTDVAAGDKTNAASQPVTIAYKKLSYTVTGSARYTTDGSTYTDDTTGGTIAISNNNGGDDFEYGDVITITATAASPTADINYYCEKIEVSTDGGTTWNTVVTSPTAAAANYSTTTMTNNTYTINAAASSYQFRASFKAYYFVTLYNSYKLDGSTYKFDAAPPRTVVIGTDLSSPRATYTYAAGTVEQCGEDSVNGIGVTFENSHIVASNGTATYYEGNKIVVYGGEQIRLNYSNLATSDAIGGVFYNNNIRYTTKQEDDDTYKNRVYKAEGWDAESDDR